MIRTGASPRTAAGWTPTCSTLPLGRVPAPKPLKPVPTARSVTTASSTLSDLRSMGSGPAPLPINARSSERPLESSWSAQISVPSPTGPTRPLWTPVGLLGPIRGICGGLRGPVGHVWMPGLERSRLRSDHGRPEVKRSPITRKKSLRQQAFDKELSSMTNELYARAENWREAMIPGICEGRHNLDRHHRRRRNVRGDGKANSLSNLLLVCRSCHELIHKEKRWARQFGFSISAHADPDLVHVNRSGINP